jgi:hypothetical protein
MDTACEFQKRRKLGGFPFPFSPSFPDPYRLAECRWCRRLHRRSSGSEKGRSEKREAHLIQAFIVPVIFAGGVAVGPRTGRGWGVTVLFWSASSCGAMRYAGGWRKSDITESVTFCPEVSHRAGGAGRLRQLPASPEDPFGGEEGEDQQTFDGEVGGGRPGGGVAGEGEGGGEDVVEGDGLLLLFGHAFGQAV